MTTDNSGVRSERQMEFMDCGHMLGDPIPSGSILEQAMTVDVPEGTIVLIQGWGEQMNPYGVIPGFMVSDWSERGGRRVVKVNPLTPLGRKKYIAKLQTLLNGPLNFWGEEDT